MDVLSQSPEEYAEKQKQELAKKQAKMQALINGEVPYTSINELMDLASAGDDFNSSFKSMAESVMTHGGKVQLMIDMAEFLKKEMKLDELKALASGEAPDGFSDYDKELFSYIQNTLGIDYGVLYKEALASKSGSTLTPEFTSIPWSGEWKVPILHSAVGTILTPTSPPEPPSKSVDDWM